MMTPVVALRPDAPESTPTARGKTAETIHATFEREVLDGLEVLDFALTQGRSVPDGVIDAVTGAGKALSEGTEVDQAAFAKAYRQLAAIVAPATAVSLRATCDKYGRQRWPLAPWRKVSEAKLWSRKLWLWTLGFCLLIVVHENVQRLLDQASQTGSPTGGWHSWIAACCPVFTTVVPFGYGALGACACLLRACHQYIHDRCFDPIHTPEYQSRMLLGAVSGGTVLLFTEYLNAAWGKTTLSGAALAFLAGYSNDFLFNFIERVVGAVMPKTENADKGNEA